MNKFVYRFRFSSTIPLEEVEGTFQLALVGIESLIGESQALMDLAHAFDATERRCVIDASSPAGRDLARLFTGLLSREFGPGSFEVERLRTKRPEPAAA